jgi:putative restriction endonuclease
MSIATYKEQFSNLNTARKLGIPAPHKAILLLSVMEQIENKQITNNRILLTESLEQTFLKLWKRYVGLSVIYQAKVATPFWHLQNEPFWRLYLNNGQDLKTITSPYSIKRLRENTYAKIDQELFQLMLNDDCRAALRVILISSYLQAQHNTTLPLLIASLVMLAA